MSGRSSVRMPFDSFDDIAPCLHIVQCLQIGPVSRRDWSSSALQQLLISRMPALKSLDMTVHYPGDPSLRSERLAQVSLPNSLFPGLVQISLQGFNFPSLGILSQLQSLTLGPCRSSESFLDGTVLTHSLSQCVNLRELRIKEFLGLVTFSDTLPTYITWTLPSLRTLDIADDYDKIAPLLRFAILPVCTSVTLTDMKPLLLCDPIPPFVRLLPPRTRSLHSLLPFAVTRLSVAVEGGYVVISGTDPSSDPAHRVALRMRAQPTLFSIAVSSLEGLFAEPRGRVRELELDIVDDDGIDLLSWVDQFARFPGVRSFTLRSRMREHELPSACVDALALGAHQGGAFSQLAELRIAGVRVDCDVVQRLAGVLARRAPLGFPQLDVSYGARRRWKGSGCRNK
ncbi:uncharacterized protein BXZ73DRAFT_77353 [Epithele typhae]|uniref:uncharacterized protein n=1 Tax=Epithele typhae TaxID=378194 RepID=UPI00200748DA|nr:uncharacterized protein BXZ73DRAFT_77353 [Epithele typhae]KAH9933193.1 hypothetical protein BXZ73DRAFT_77353 [Epithele typhae]